MIKRTSVAMWEGNLQSGSGTMRVGDGAFEGPYSFPSRFENGSGTNPEELIAAAHAGCFSMALAHALTQAGHPPARVETTAEVRLEKSGDGFRIPEIHLETTADVHGLDEAEFQKHASAAKENCPVSSYCPERRSPSGPSSWPDGLTAPEEEPHGPFRSRSAYRVSPKSREPIAYRCTCRRIVRAKIMRTGPHPPEEPPTASGGKTRGAQPPHG